MVSRFDELKEQSTRYTRAQQIWQILVARASNRQTLTYKHLAEILHFGAPHVVAQFLEPVMCYCHAYKLPPLTIIVVNQETGEPGSGLVTIVDQNRDREAVFNCDWFNIIPPTPSDLEEFHRNSPLHEEDQN